jgi:hypothetical protein
MKNKFNFIIKILNLNLIMFALMNYKFTKISQIKKN